MRKINGFLFVPYILWMILFIVVPVILLIYFSMIDIHGDFSLENYKQMMTTKYFLMLWDSVLYAVLITLTTLLISYPAAYFIRTSKHQNVWLLILIIPTWINLLLKTYAFIGLFSHDSIINRILYSLHLPRTELLHRTSVYNCSKLYLYSIYDFTNF